MSYKAFLYKKRKWRLGMYIVYSSPFEKQMLLNGHSFGCVTETRNEFKKIAISFEVLNLPLDGINYADFDVTLCKTQFLKNHFQKQLSK